MAGWVSITGQNARDHTRGGEELGGPGRGRKRIKLE